MKRIFLVTIMLFFACIIAFAQQTGSSPQQTSAQIKQDAQQTLNQAKTNSSQFESTLDALKTQISSGGNAATYKRLKGNIDALESKITAAEAHIQSEINMGHTVSAILLTQLQQMIDQHKTAIADLEAFIAK